MNGLINNFDFKKKNFWEVAGNLRMVPVISDFYNSDKTKGREHSSKIMWAIAMLVDQSDENKIKNLPTEEKRQIIEDDWIKPKQKFIWDTYKDVIKAYKNTQLTSLQRSLAIYKTKVEERTKFLAETPYTMENAKDLDSMIANSEKIFNVIKTLDKLADEEMKGGNDLKGGRKKGLQEKGRF